MFSFNPIYDYEALTIDLKDGSVERRYWDDYEEAYKRGMESVVLSCGVYSVIILKDDETVCYMTGDINRDKVGDYVTVTVKENNTVEVIDKNRQVYVDKLHTDMAND